MEKRDSTKHMINMKTVITSTCILGITVILAIPLGNIDQRNVPVNMIMMDSMLTIVLAQLIQKPPIKEFFLQKLSQKRTNLTENLLVYKDFFHKMSNSKVHVQNARA